MYLRDDAAPAPFNELPSVMVRPDMPRPAPGEPHRFLLASCSANIEKSFSGTTYYLGCAGMDLATIDGIAALDGSGSKPSATLLTRKAWWYALKRLHGGKVSGFKFSNSYNDYIWKDNIDKFTNTVLINNFQLFGPYFRDRYKALGITPCFYIDGTLKEYFEAYAEYDTKDVDSETIKAALAEEAAGYRIAERIFVMSAASADTLVAHYAVPREKIHIVVPGANLLEGHVAHRDAAARHEAGEDFILGFVGFYPERKGLYPLIDALEILRADKVPVRLRVVGNCMPSRRNVDGLDYYGPINKASEPDRFLDAIAGVHLGCLLTRAELAGISMVEFLRLGIPILGTNVGGARDILAGGGSIAVDASSSPAEIAAVIRGIVNDRSRYLALFEGAKARRDWATWTRAAREIDKGMPAPRISSTDAKVERESLIH
jgi:glycosyltransferase involved in cell wall biosynthesis